MTIDSLCNSCTNKGCEFQSGIVRTECAFYMPPHIEPDNCGNYVVQPQVEAIPKTDYKSRLKSDMVSMLDKIRAEIIEKYWDCDICKYNGHFSIRGDINDILQIIDKYKIESEE